MEILGQRCACLVFAGLNVCISAVIHLRHSVHPGWNSLTACTQALLKRKGALQELWSARKFSFQADRVDGQAPELPRSERFHVTGNFIRDVSEAITSQRFWSYCRMINVFSSFLSHLASWCEGCLCHEEELLEGPSFYHLQRVTRHSNLTCDYKGRRAPELAAGVLDEKVRVMVATSLSEILATSHGLSEEQQGHILMDFHSAIDKTMLEVQVKTAVATVETCNFRPPRPRNCTCRASRVRQDVQGQQARSRTSSCYDQAIFGSSLSWTL